MPFPSILHKKESISEKKRWKKRTYKQLQFYYVKLILHILRQLVTSQKVKVPPRTSHEGPQQEQKYGSTLSLTLALDGGGLSMPHPSCFTPEKETWYPLHKRLDGPQGQYGQGQKISFSPGFDPQTILPVASCYTNYSLQSVTS